MTMTEMTMPEDVKKVQKALNKLISEEMLAYLTYNAYTIAADPVNIPVIAETFKEIAEDELNDHHANLVAWALAHGYDIPCNYKEYAKHASEVSVAAYDKVKKNQDARYYIEEAIKAECDAIMSYTEFLDADYIPYDLNAIMLQNYYDELEHSEDLRSLLYGIDAKEQFGFD